MNIRKKSLLLVVLFAALVPASLQAQVLGNNDLDLIFIADRESSGGDAIDIYRPSDQTLLNNAFRIAGSTNEIEAITDSNTPGIAYAITESGAVYKLDYTTGTSSQIANLDPPGTSSGHSFFTSITNLPGSDEIFVLRSDTLAGGGATDWVGTFNPETGASNLEFSETTGGGAIDISDGPALASVSATEPALIYVIATGGSFEAVNPATGANVQLAAVPTAGHANSDFEGITNTGDSTSSVYLLNDLFTSASSNAADIIVEQTLPPGATRTDRHTTVGSGGVALTDVGASDPDAVVAVATGGAIAHIGDIDGSDGPPSVEFDAGTSASGTVASDHDGAYRDVTNAPASPYGFIYIADDGTANEIDTYNASGINSNDPDSDIFKNSAVLSDTATTTGAPAGDDYQDVSVTDAQVPDGAGGSTPFIFELHTDGSLFKIDAVTGAGSGTAFATLTTGSTTHTTYDSITNIPGTTLLAILRTDRPLDVSVFGGSADFIDLYDFDSMTLQEAAFTSTNSGTLAITDGPSYNGEDGTFTDGVAIYTIASGGAFEVFDTFQPAGTPGGGTTGKRAVISGGTEAGGSYYDITNVPGDPDNLYVISDRTSGSDQVYRMHLDGSTETLLANAFGGAGRGITDTNDGGLFATAEGGTISYIALDGSRINLGNYNGIGTISSFGSVTNISPVPEPSSALALLTILTATLFGHRRRRKLAA